MLAFSLFRRAKTFGYDWGITMFGLSAVAAAGGVGFYKLRFDPLNEHPAVLKAVDIIGDSGLFRKDQLAKDWPVMGRVHEHSRAKLSFNIITPQGNGKVQIVSHLANPNQAQTKEGWTTDSLVIDFLDSKERVVYDVNTQRWYKETTPAGAIQMTDVLLSGSKKVYGPLMDMTTDTIVNHPYRWLAGLAVTAVAFKFRRRVLPDPLFGHVRGQLNSNKELAKLVGEPVKVGYMLDGKISSPTANFAIEVSGPEAKGKVQIQAYKDDGNWKITFSKLRLDGNPKTHQINIR